MPTFTEVVASTFTGSDEVTLSEGGAWATVTGEAAFARTGNAAVASPTSDCGARHTTAMGNDQYARADLTCVGTTGVSSGIGISVRIDSAARTYYRLAIDHAAANNAAIDRFITGTFANRVRWTQAFTDGDQFTIGIEGQIIYVYDKTETLVQTFDDTGGGGPTTGSVGISFSSSETSDSLDDFKGGTFSASAGGPLPGSDIATTGLAETIKTIAVSLSIQESG